jgi:hypothetical protein
MTTARSDNQRYGPLRVFASLLRRWRTDQTRALRPSIVYLNPHTTASFMVRRSPLRLTCFSGVLWVTCHCDPQDYFLTAGQHFAARRRGLLVIHAFSASRFAVQCSEGTATRVGRCFQTVADQERNSLESAQGGTRTRAERYRQQPRWRGT